MGPSSQSSRDLLGIARISNEPVRPDISNGRIQDCMNMFIKKYGAEKWAMVRSLGARENWFVCVEKTL